MPTDSKGEYREKRAGEKADFTIDWSELLGVDTIASSAWSVPAGITQTTPSPSFTNTTTTIWLSGGTAGVEYDLLNTVTTASARIFPRSLRIKVLADVVEAEEFTVNQLMALRNAYAQGVLTCEYDGKRVT